jgi:integrase
MKHHELTSEWLENWDRGCKGLVVRGGPTGTKRFYRWEDAKDPATGQVRRRRVPVGHWPAVTLSDARAAVNKVRDARHVEIPGAELSVKQLAEAYRRDVLSNQERGEEAYKIILTHVVNAQPDPRRPAFGEWPAASVRPPDLAAIIRHAIVRRTVGSRHIGGRAVARAIAREIKAIFAHAEGTGSLEVSPAGTLKGKLFGLRASKRSRYLDADEIKAFFAALDLTALLDGTANPQKLSATARLGCAFQLYIPLRSHSIIGAKWEEFDLDAGRWTVPVARLKMHKDDRAEARPFTVPLPATAVLILRRLRELAPSSAWVLASPKDPTKHIYHKVLVRALGRLFESGRLALGSKATIHDLRRTWRTLGGELGIASEVLERSMGHAAEEGVAAIYARGQMVERRAKAGEIIGAALDRIRLGTSATVVPLAERQSIG